MTTILSRFSTEIAIAWCLSWNQDETGKRKVVREAIANAKTVDEKIQAFPKEIQKLISQVQALKQRVQQSKNSEGGERFPKTNDALTAIANEYPELRDARIGLIYGGAT